MDELDRKLIALLRDNARMSVASLSKKLGVTQGTVHNRLSKLEGERMIMGYTIRLRPQVEEHRVWGS